MSTSKQDSGRPTRNSPDSLNRLLRLLSQLRSTIEAEFGRPLTYEERADLLGEPKSTLGNWFNGASAPPPELLLRLLELLPPRVRHPTLERPRLSQDPVAASRMQHRLMEGRRVVHVYGEQDHVVTFVVSALGHSWFRLRSRTCIRGVDSHAPEWFVPVPGLTYLESGANLAEIRHAAKRYASQMLLENTSLAILMASVAKCLRWTRPSIGFLQRHSSLLARWFDKAHHPKQ